MAAQQTLSRDCNEGGEQYVCELDKHERVVDGPPSLAVLKTKLQS